jgi:hypothetical protein
MGVILVRDPWMQWHPLLALAAGVIVVQCESIDGAQQ